MSWKTSLRDAEAPETHESRELQGLNQCLESCNVSVSSRTKFGTSRSWRHGSRVLAQKVLCTSLRVRVRVFVYGS